MTKPPAHYHLVKLAMNPNAPLTHLTLANQNIFTFIFLVICGVSHFFLHFTGGFVTEVSTSPMARCQTKTFFGIALVAMRSNC